MYKYIFTVLFILSTSAAASHHKGGREGAEGWGMERTTETLAQYGTPPGSPERYKLKIRGSGPFAGITIDYIRKSYKNTYSFIMGTYKEFVMLPANRPKNRMLENLKIMGKNNLQSSLTLELSSKIAHHFTPETQLYSKLGLLQAKETLNHSTQQPRGWGSILGLGIQQSYKNIKLNLEYTYRHFGRSNKNGSNALSRTFKGSSNRHTQYHTILFGITRTF